MAHLSGRALALLPCVLAFVAWFSRLTLADGRVFLLELRNGSNGGYEEASQACEAQDARLASGMELRHAVVECSFSACTQGWLTGPSIGTTVCRSMAGSLRAVNMRVENVTETSERLAAFCVKDTGAPCGSPPSFPNTHLQGRTGLELGDELLYACNPGYTLPNGETAFSLLCDSCGEWYGLVQLCVKDGAEAFIDYEDKLPDDHHLYEGLEEVHRVSLRPEVTEITNHEEAEDSTPEPEQGKPVAVEKDERTDEEDPGVFLTEPPVSQVSQKHMFWFPSEAFHEDEHPFVSTETPIKAHTKDENYITAKTDDRQPIDTEKTAEEDDGDLTHEPATDEPVGHSVGSTEESWLDGYPIPQEEEKAGQGSTDEGGPGGDAESDHSKVDGFESVTESPEEATVGGVIHDHLEEETEDTSVKPEGHDEEDQGTKFVTEGHEENPFVGVFDGHDEETYHRVTEAPEGTFPDGGTDLSGGTHIVTEEPMAEEMDGGVKSPSEDMETKDVSDSSKDIFHGVTDTANDIEMSPTSLTSLTQITASLDHDKTHNKRPAPYTPGSAPENVSTSQDGMGFEHTITPSGMAPLDTTPTQDVHIVSNVATPTVSVSWETKDHGPFLEKSPTIKEDVSTESYDDQSVIEGDRDRSLDQKEKAEDGACGEEPCKVAGRGPTIAAIIVGIVAALVGLALGVWCYKKRQQKSSHYQLNGTNRQTQCIELQQTV
ncbi:sushi domain-containing protein 5 [Astyanax mexicanus]|uniref:Sushi domain containing 5 n=1 Tax=Astyanax mexicanus TaxID=7994 RepID=A0A8B9RDW1_ASTMX|nr:sushi domain-containing protein 5 [Astyanax mexicanus]